MLKEASLEKYLPPNVEAVDEPFGSFKSYIKDDTYATVLHRMPT